MIQLTRKNSVNLKNPNSSEFYTAYIVCYSRLYQWICSVFDACSARENARSTQGLCPQTFLRILLLRIALIVSSNWY